MKSKKGYSLIELLLVISIVVIITTIAIVSFVTIKNKQKEKDYNNMVENVQIASELYLRNNEEFKEYLNNVKVVNLPVKKLIEDGLLDENNTINPVNNTSIKDYCLSVTVGSSEEYLYGDLRECGSFLAIYPNPLIIYDRDEDLLQGIVAYDAEGNPIANPNITVEPNAKDKLQVNETVTIKYTFDGREYERLVLLQILKTEVTTDTEYVIEVSGYYKITAYGAQGSGNGGLGGMVETTQYFNKGDRLQLRVGTQTNGGAGQYPGGGASTISKGGVLLLGAAGGGGGATGTYGGAGTGKAGTCGTNYDTSITCTNGTNGDTFGTSQSISGGGSSGNYKSCTKFKTVYDSCATGYNSCSPGYVTDTSNCLAYNSCSYCSCLSYGTKYDSCATTKNTCAYGCDRVYNSCKTTTTTNEANCSKCGYKCSSGTLSGSYCITYTKTTVPSCSSCSGTCQCTQ